MSALIDNPSQESQVHTRVQMWSFTATLAQILMEVSLVSLWYQALFPTVALSWAAIFGFLTFVYLGSYALVQLVRPGSQPDYPRREVLLRQGLILAWFVVMLIGSLRLMVFAGTGIHLVEMLRHPEHFFTHTGTEGAGFTHLVSIALLTWRGFLLAQRPATQAAIQRSFQIGLMLLLIYGMSYAQAHPNTATIGLYFYLFWALIAMSAARITSLSVERSGRLPRFAQGWLLGIFFAALGFVGLAILFGWFASQRIINWIITGIVIILASLTALIYPLFDPLFALIFRLINGVIDILRRLFERFSYGGLPAFMKDITDQINQAISKYMSVNLGSHLIVVVTIAVLIGVTLLIGIRFRIYRRQMEEEENGQVEAGKAFLGLENLIRRLIPDRLALRLRTPGQMLAAARIRYIYRRLTALSQKLGVERPPSLTPLEFIPRLAAIFPNNQAEVDQITAAYVRIRYGEYPETLREVEDVQRAWDAIRRSRRAAKI